MTNIETALTRTLGFGGKTFIEKSLEGGWTPDAEYAETISIDEFGILYKTASGDMREEFMSEILLEPDAWQAVGKVDGWQGKLQPSIELIVLKAHMRHFTDTLCELSAL